MFSQSTGPSLNRRRGARDGSAVRVYFVPIALFTFIALIFMGLVFSAHQTASSLSINDNNARSANDLSPVKPDIDPKAQRNFLRHIHLPFDNHLIRKPPILIKSDSEKNIPKAPAKPLPKDYTFPYLGDATVDSQNFKPKGGDRFTEWVKGDTPFQVTPALMQDSDKLARLRRTHVRAAMEHAWSSYKKYAFGQDELLPISASSRNNWGGMGVTLVDSLDTLWLMGMKTEFKEATEWVRDHLSFSHVGQVSVFETTIRSLGGLLSAYDWSGESILLEKALDLGERLARSFDCDSGIPCPFISLSGGSVRGGSNSNAAEIGTLQVEFRYLSKATGRKDFATKAEHVYDELKRIQPSDGLYPYRTYAGSQGLRFGNDHVSFGAMGDSLFEYMLKIWLQGGKKESMYRDMYDKAMQGMHDGLVQKSSPSGLTYIAERPSHGTLDHKFDHLVCFMGGLLALGAYTDPLGLNSDRAQRDLRTAKALTYTCYQMYARMPTGLAPEIVHFYPEMSADSDNYNILRPETVESFFILNKLTGDPIYREWGWEIFLAFEKYSKTKIAYGSVHNIMNTDGEGNIEDRMESFFLAETLKYMYLLFDPDTEVDILNKHVFNTEAHPVKILPLVTVKAAS